ncbi:hypothetical protein M231_03060 [Tremella mesenterica]|uniref:Uncharacterized protein n=1 Tax=Tremella mesenterica TaxID=5217 RepID=A0A4Q1BP91_TREME|nr:hypothetical protein M231_03060 [Tremella mesenterica]
MGAVSSALDPDRGSPGIEIPEGYVTPSFPSLYIPTFRSTRLQVGIFLYEAETIWKFTLYWTLLFLGSIFFICSVLASFTSLLSLTILRPSDNPINVVPKDQSRANASRSPSTRRRSEASEMLVKRMRAKRIKPPLWPVFIFPLIMTSIAGVVGVISGTVVGFALAAVYSAGGFAMSTSYSTLTSIL